MKLTAKQLIERYEKKKADRSVWNQHFQEINDYVLPRKNNITKHFAKGAKRNLHLLDNTAVVACELLAGALHGLLTNPYSQWFELTSGNPKIDSDDSAREWLQDCERRMLNVLNDSNFQTEVHEFYLDLCGVSTANLLMEDDDDTIVRFSAKFIANYVICENSKGIVDTVYCEWDWDAETIAEEFGVDNLTKKVKAAYDKKTDEKFKIIHAVYPQDKYRKAGGKLKNFDFISQYVCQEDEDDLKVEGYYEQPYLVSRWAKASDEELGRGPGMAALPEAKIINKMTETIIKASQKVIDPPLQLPDDGFIMPLRTYPGGLNFRRSGTDPGDRIEPVFNQDIRIDFGIQAMDQHRQRIKQAFYVDQLTLSNDGPQRTATQVNRETSDSMRFLGPMLGRQQSEFLSPLINRLFKMMNRKNLFLVMPDIMKQATGLSVQYSSAIAKMQRATESQSIQTTLQDLAPFMQVDPSIADNFDGDMALRVIAKINGFPQEIIRNLAKVKQIRASRAQAQQQVVNTQQENQQVDSLAKVAPAAQALQPKK